MSAVSNYHTQLISISSHPSLFMHDIWYSLDDA
uniref:Uncharacterized protein n=1 Tax=Arundo donax TaxID=35708 RepID=A0A0A9H175_ARUDO